MVEVKFSSLAVSVSSIVGTVLVMLLLDSSRSGDRNRRTVDLTPIEQSINSLHRSFANRPTAECPACPDCRCEYYANTSSQAAIPVKTVTIERTVEKPGQCKRPSLAWYDHMKIAVERENLGQVYYGVADTAWMMGYVTWQCPPGFELSRVGPMFEGGKNACLPPKSKRAVFAGKCLIYSFGSNGQFEFEVDMYERFGCEIHTFDCTMKKPAHCPSFVNYHEWCLGKENPDPANAVYMSYWQMVQKLGLTNREPLLMKMDIEGWEWIFLEEYFRPNSPIPRINQFLLEMHDARILGWKLPWPKKYEPNPPINQLIEGQGQHINQVLQAFIDLDTEFDMVAKEHNMYPSGAIGCLPCSEFTFIRRDYNWSQWGLA
jgi:hypothetical protein